MSFIPRPTRSQSPRNSASPKRRALHERSDSANNELAGSGAPSPRLPKLEPDPVYSDDLDPVYSDEPDFVYSQSPFPRLPSQVLKPSGQPLIFEDSSASLPANPSSRIPRWPAQRARPAQSRSPKGKERLPLTPSDLTPLDTSMPPPPPRLSSRSPRSPRSPRTARASPPVGTPGRSNSKVRSIVDAIEEASLRTESLPPTPRPQSKPRQSPRASPSPRFSFIPPLHDEPVPELPPLLQSVPGASEPVVQRPILDSEEPFTAWPSSVPGSAVPSSDPAMQPLSSSPPVEARESGLSLSRALLAMRSNETLPEMQERPRSSSAPSAPTDALLQALLASGANVQYPRLEKPSMASMDTDSSSMRRAYPQPLNLRRKQARSQLGRMRALSSEDEPDFILEYDDRLETRDPPSTPPRQTTTESSLTSHWTPGRWNAELEDTVPELNPHALRTQHSFYGERDSFDSRPGSVCSTQSGSSIGFYRFLNDSKTAWAKSYYGGSGTLRNVTPPYLSAASIGRMPSSRTRSASASLSGHSNSRESEELPDQIFIPRRRPYQRKPGIIPSVPDNSSSQDVQLSERFSEEQTSAGQAELVHQSPRRAHQRTARRLQDLPMPQWSHPYSDQPVPHLSPDRSADPRYSVMRPPSFDGYGWLTPVNVQISLAVLGFVCPFCWMIGAFLRLPPRPELPLPDPEAGLPEVTPEEQQAFLEDPEVRQYHKARFWRNVNRAMSITGLCVIAVVIALAIIATR